MILIIKYVLIADRLREQITNGILQPGEAMKSEEELGQEYGVSRITIKQALSILVDEGLICRVKGYGTFVKAASEKSNYALVMSLNFGTDMAALEIISGVQQYFTANNGRTFIEFGDGTAENEKSIMSRLLTQSLDGIIVYVNHHDAIRESVQAFESKGCPVVLIDRYDIGSPCNAVISNHWDGGYLACEYLYEKGHRSIAVVHENPALTSEAELLSGCRAMLKKHGLDCLTYENGNKPDSSFLKMIKSNKITALLCANDLTATVVIDYLKANGLSCPENVSVVGFADVHPLATQYNLTTVKQNFRCMGTDAAKLVLELKNAKIRGYKKESLPTELIERKTVRDIRK